MSKQRKTELDLYRLYAKDEAFYQAFNIKPENKLYLAPEKRVKIW